MESVISSHSNANTALGRINGSREAVNVALTGCHISVSRAHPEPNSALSHMGVNLQFIYL